MEKDTKLLAANPLLPLLSFFPCTQNNQLQPSLFWVLLPLVTLFQTCHTQGSSGWEETRQKLAMTEEISRNADLKGPKEARGVG